MLICIPNQIKIKSRYLNEIFSGFLNEIPILQMSYIIKIENSSVYRKTLYSNAHIKSFHHYFFLIYKKSSLDHMHSQNIKIVMQMSFFIKRKIIGSY